VAGLVGGPGADPPLAEGTCGSGADQRGSRQGLAGAGRRHPGRPEGAGHCLRTSPKRETDALNRPKSLDLALVLPHARVLLTTADTLREEAHRAGSDPDPERPASDAAG
jgi:hypothetical protein